MPAVRLSTDYCILDSGFTFIMWQHAFSICLVKHCFRLWRKVAHAKTMPRCKSGHIQKAAGFILLKLSIDSKVWKPGLFSNWPRPIAPSAFADTTPFFGSARDIFKVFTDPVVIGTISDVTNDKLTCVELDLVRWDVAEIFHEANLQRNGWLGSCLG